MALYLPFVFSLLVLPLFTLGLIRKIKARLQNRIGASVWQPFYHIAKLLRKGETISETASWLFRLNAALNCAMMLIVACLAPWLSYKPAFAGDDLFLIVYMLAFMRFFTILSSLDTASPFGTFAASREATLSLLVEPAVVLSLVALAVPAHTTSLGQIFAAKTATGATVPCLWFLSGMGLFLASLVELSRMPVDDPATHLELTMVHEAMILENSGRNLALIEFSYALRLCVLFGISAQCFLNVLSYFYPLQEPLRAVLSVAAVAALGAVTALIEALAVKLQWRKVPEFIAYSLTMSLLAVLVSIANGAQL